MVKKGKKARIISMVLIFVFIFSLGVISFADEKMNPEKGNGFTKDLEGLIKKKVITDEELVKIKEYLEEERKERRKVFEEIKDMNEEERKEFVESYRKTKVNIVDKMIKDEIINEKQGEEIKKIMPKCNHRKRKE